jgi:streptogramin lyase
VDLATAADGTLWYTYSAFRRVDRITAGGPVTGPLTSPPTGFNPHHLMSGPDPETCDSPAAGPTI